MYLIAHRGASKFYPENTILAFEKAIEEKYDCIELDVRLTKDDTPVVIHDATINRTSNGGNQYIHNLTVDQLKQYDFGSWLDPKFQHEEIPTLEEVFQLIENKPIELNIELKSGPIASTNLEKKVLDLVYQYQLENRVIFSAFDHQRLERLYRLDSNIEAGFIFPVNLIDVFHYIDRLSMNIFSIHSNYYYVTKEMIAEAHKRNIKVNAYTVDQVNTARKLQDIKIDGLITNKITHEDIYVYNNNC